MDDKHFYKVAYESVLNMVLDGMRNRATRLVVSGQYHLQTLPEVLTNWKELEHLEIQQVYYFKLNFPRGLIQLENIKVFKLYNVTVDSPEALGNAINQWKNLEELHLEHTREVAWKLLGMLPKLKKLTIIHKNIFANAEDLAAIAQFLCKLPQLEHLTWVAAGMDTAQYIAKHKHQFPFSKTLKTLVCSFQETTDVQFIHTFPNLEYLYLPMRILETFPQHLLQLPYLTHLQFNLKNGSKTAQGIRAGFLRPFFQLRPVWNDKNREQFLYLLLQSPDNWTIATHLELAQALDCGIHLLEIEAHSEIARRIQLGTMSSHLPLRKGESEIWLAGTFNKSMIAIKERLFSIGIYLNHAQTPNTTHILLGAGNVAKEAYEWALEHKEIAVWTPAQIRNWLDEQQPSFINTNLEQKQENLAKIHNLLATNEIHNIELAIQIITSVGCPPELLTDVLLVWKDTQRFSPEIRQQAARLLYANCSEKLYVRLKRNIRLNNIHAKLINKNIHYFCDGTELNRLRMYQYFYRNYNANVVFLQAARSLEVEELAILLQLFVAKSEGKISLDKICTIETAAKCLAALAKNQGITELNLSYLGIEELPEEIYDFADLQTLIWHNNRVAETLFSPKILRLKHLKTIRLGRKPQQYGFDLALAKFEIITYY